MKVYQNQELKYFIENECQINPLWKERDFVSYARKYMHSGRHEVLAIGGLRGTGKTVGLLQSVSDLDAIYITAQKEESETGRDYIEILKKTEKKHIIIDEYSWIKDRKDLDFFLYTLVQNGKRVAITGTESITLDFLNYGNLIHRVDMIHVNLFTYEEFCRLYDKEPTKESCKEYLMFGGVFKEYAITNYNSMKNYIKTAIIDNLVGYMNGALDEEKAAALVYSVLYKAICPSNLKSVPTLKQNRLTVENFLEEFGIHPQVSFSEWELKNVTDILSQIGVVIELKNYDEHSEKKYQYYITNPSLTCQLILNAYKLPELTNDILGHVFEASVICHLEYHRFSEHTLCFLDTVLENGANKELDAVILTEKQERVYLIECKYREDDTLSRKATILDDNLEDVFPDSIIDGRYVIYNGNPVVHELGNKQVIFSPINEVLNNYSFFERNAEEIKNIPLETKESLPRRNIQKR